ncbi:MAG: lipopolysaccharide kinase InaA family protein [Arenicellales bacterium]
MSNEQRSPFRISEALRPHYRRFSTRGYEGWVDGDLLDSLTPDQASKPKHLFKLPGAQVVRDRRNLTARVPIGDRWVWIKLFRPSDALDRFLYARRPGKAAYAWNAAMMLMKAGFCTPRPLIGLRRQGKDGGAEGIVAFEDLAGHVPLARLFGDESPEEGAHARLMYELGDCLRRFHDHGFRHRDLRQGNILVARTGDGWSFCFLDLNRLRIQRRLNDIQRLREVEKLNLPALDLPAFFDAYMPDENSANMAEAYLERVDFADHLEHLPQGRLIRKAWYYSQELRAFGFARRP